MLETKVGWQIKDDISFTPIQVLLHFITKIVAEIKIMNITNSIHKYVHI